MAANPEATELFPDLFPAVNHHHYLFLDPRSREFYVDWERSAREVTSALRLKSTDPEVAAVIAHLEATSPDFRRLWAQQAVRLHTGGFKRVRHPIRGDTTIEYQTFAVPGQHDMLMTNYLASPGHEQLPHTGTDVSAQL